jgi:hypothetical protein
MAGSTTGSRDSEVHASWIACFAGACWIPLGMWIWFLQALWGAGPQERMGIALAGPYLTLIAGFGGALVCCVGLSIASLQAHLPQQAGAVAAHYE